MTHQTTPRSTPSRPTRPGSGTRVLRRAGVVLLLLGAPAMVACGSDSEDDPVVNSVPDSTEAPATDQSPPSSGQEQTPTEDPGTNGADPGQDNQQLDPPGGTTPVPDPGGDSGGANGDGVNPDTDNS